MIYGTEIKVTNKTKEEKITAILEWLYLNEKEMGSAKEWKKELIKQLYILAE